VEKGDILTVFGGLVIVLVIALVVNPHYLAGLQPLAPAKTTAPTPEPVPDVSRTPYPAETVPAPVMTAVPSPPPTSRPPYRIFYTDKPFSYPSVMLPDRLDIYGESDIRRPEEDFVTFASLDEQRGGLTRVFTIPYPVWAMNIHVFDNATPNVGSFRLALCYASNGTVIDGLEMIHPGTSFKKIQTSNIPLYLIVSTTGIDGFRIDFQTTRDYYTSIIPQTTVQGVP